MKYTLFLHAFLLLFAISSFSQVGIGTITPNAQLDIQSSSQATPLNIDGILIPKIDDFPSPVVLTVLQDGMMVFVTGSGTPAKGFYYWDHASLKWKAVGSKKIDDLSDGKSDSNGSSVFLGMEAGLVDDGTSNQNVGVGYRSLYSNIGNIGGTNNTAVGYETLVNNVSGNSNTAIGAQSLRVNTVGYNTAIGSQTLMANTTGVFNTAIGYSALTSNVLGYNNTAIGVSALKQNTGTPGNGNDNTAIGFLSLTENTIGRNNTATGSSSLKANTTGAFNTALGYEALISNTIAGSNTATGARSLNKNTTGQRNTANGMHALFSNVSGEDNTASGFNALFSNTAGEVNTATGVNALYSHTSGNYNSAYGVRAIYFLTKGGRNTAMGYEALSGLTEGGRNTAMGNEALSGLTKGDNNIAIGNNAQVPNGTESNQVRIGDTSITSATCQVPFTSPSDIRWKKEVRTLPFGLNMIEKLHPVDYIRKNNNANTRDIGFIAQEVQQVLQDLNYDDQGLLSIDDNGFLSLRYNDFIPVLVKAIQEQQEQIEILQNKNETYAQKIESYDGQNKDLEKRIEKLEALLTHNAVVKD